MSHYTVLVIGDDVEGQLAPYDENVTVERYKSYWDSDQILTQEEIFSDPKKGKGEESYPSELVLQSKPGDADLKEIVRIYNARYVEPYDEEEEGDARAYVDEGGIYEWSTYNPKSKWDWYSVGGRWTGYFKLKEIAEREHAVGSPGLMTARAPAGTADQIHKGDVDAEAMRDDAAVEAGELWDKVHAVIGDLPEARSWDDLLADNGLAPGDVPLSSEERGERLEKVRETFQEQARVKAIRESEVGKDWFMGPSVTDFQIPREEYVENARNNAFAPYAYVLEGEWYGKGKMGWWGMSSDKMEQQDWARQFNEMFDALPDDTLLTLVDCHI